MRCMVRPHRLLPLVLLALCVATTAVAQDATLYEVTEAVKFSFDPAGPPGAPTGRRALGALLGTAALGTAPCPYEFLLTDPRARTCAVTVLGTEDLVFDYLSVPASLTGHLQGKWATVVQGDNPVDGPELVVLKGDLFGDMDLSPTLMGIPLGRLNGTITRVEYVNETLTIPAVTCSMTGTVRLPFSRGNDGRPDKPVRGKDAFYLGGGWVDDHLVPGKPFSLGKDELSLGTPTVRLEVSLSSCEE